MIHEAKFYSSLPDGSVQCNLCPHECMLKEGKTGICRVRTNVDGKLITDVYGFVSSMHLDPIEKKPFYHFYPGSVILSLGTYGCNLRCFFCQNCTISQTGPAAGLSQTELTADEIIKQAKARPDNIGVAFTYNEPIVSFEYVYDVATKAKQAGLKTALVSNGFINPEPLQELLSCIDAFNIDLKAFSEDFYSKVTSARLEPVKQTLKAIKAAGKHLEIVNLLIPELNDDDVVFTEMVRWIALELGRETVLHISRYFPNYKLFTESTPVSALRRARRIAEKELTWVYIGNLHTENNDTHCQICNNKLIIRNLYTVTKIGLDSEGKCTECGNIFLKKV